MDKPLIDMILRIGIIAFLFFSGCYVLYIGTKEKEIESKRKFCITFSLFFFFTGFNYLLSELELQLAPESEETIFPIIIDNESVFNWFLIRPVNSDFYLQFFFLVSIVPMLYALEKYILDKKKVISATIGGIGLIGLVVIFFWHSIEHIINAVILYNWVVMVLLAFRVILVYLNMARKVTGPVKTTGILIGVGFILSLFGVIATSLSNILGSYSEVIGHLISLGGTVMIFIGVLKMK